MFREDSNHLALEQGLKHLNANHQATGPLMSLFTCWWYRDAFDKEPVATAVHAVGWEMLSVTAGSKKHRLLLCNTGDPLLLGSVP